MARDLPPPPFKASILDDRGGLVSQAWAGWLQLAFQRMGGSIAKDNNELDVSAPGSVTTSMIDDDAVTADKLADHASTDASRAVTTNHIRDGAVTVAKLGDDSVTADKLKDSVGTDGDRAVTTNHIRDANVTTAKLADDSVTADKLADHASTDASRAVTTNHIRDSAVTTEKINALAVTAAKIASYRTVTGTRSAPVDVTTSGITPAGVADELIFVQGSGGAINITANPQIAAGTAVGQVLSLVGRSASSTVLLEDGNGLDMNGEYLLTDNAEIGFNWDGTNWSERYRR